MSVAAGSGSDFTERIADALAAVPGALGVVLGGSRARGTHAPDSDYDFGLYYDSEASLELAALARAAKALDDERRDDLIAPLGGWGRWVNGGGWLTVGGRQVDVILRDFRRVEEAVGECLAGIVHAHYQTGHPHAYLNTMYAGELAIARVLRDASGRVQALREKTRPYPEKLRAAIVHQFGFEMGFSAMLAAANAGKDDPYYLAAHIVRSLSCCNQVLFAVNGEYCINEKKAVAMIDAFPIKPAGYGRRVAEVLRMAGEDGAAATRLLQTLVEDTAALAETAGPAC